MTIKGRRATRSSRSTRRRAATRSLEALAKLPGLTGKDGTHTAGNSPGVNDGGGALVLASDEWAERNGKEILGHDHRPGRRSPTSSPTSPARPPTRRRRRSTRRACSRATSTCGRSTRRSPRSTLNSIRMLGIDEDASTSTAARSRSATRSARPARASSARSCSSCAAAAAATAARRSAPAAARATRSSCRCDERPHILPRRRAAGRSRPRARGAAFFDLDRTLMAGSSAFQFGRAAYKAGLVTPARLAARRAGRTSCFRLRGSTDAGTDALRERVGETARGRAGARPAAARAATCSPACCRGCTRRCSRSPTRHQDAGRPIFICTAASQEMAELLAIVLTLRRRRRLARRRSSTASTPAAPAGPFTYREGKAQAIRELAEREGIDLAAS